MLDLLTYAAEILVGLIALPFVIAGGYWVLSAVVFVTMILIGVV